MLASVLTGLEVLRQNNFSLIKGRNVGLVVNPASVDSALRSTIDVLRGSDAINLLALFGPQHGIRGETQDNMVEWEGFRDPETGVMVYSLYGETRAPLPEMVKNIDCLVIDLPDVGARYYTFAWTVTLCLQACQENRISCVVLDRPNPITGIMVEGPVLDPSFSSFVGLYPLPIRHGMTMGELALYVNREFGINCDLTVVPMEGWERWMWYENTGLPWVLPSPNMPTVDTAVVYPGMALLEGTGVSEGRGTTRPFEIFGSPGVNPYALVRALERTNLSGVTFRPLHFVPTFQKHQGKLCGGAQLHVTNRSAFLPVLTGVAVIRVLYYLCPELFRWKEPPYEYEVEKLPIDVLAGSDRLRLQIEGGCSLEEICLSWKGPADNFLERRKPYLLY